MKTKPYNRHETFLAALTDSAVTVPIPLTREERYLAKIAGEDVTIPATPYNRYETYLAKLAGQNVTVPLPSSRLELYLHKACDYDTQEPTPVSREEIFWERYIGKGISGETTVITIDDACAEAAKKAIVTITPTITGVTSAELRRTGVNLWGGDALLEDIKSALTSTTVDEVNKTIKYAAGATAIKVFIDNIFKLKTRYTFVIRYKNLTTTAPNMAVVYTDATTKFTLPKVSAANTEETVVYVSQNNRTINDLRNMYNSGTTVIYATESGIFEGVHTADDFVPYAGDVYTTDLSFAGTVYGGTLDIVNGLLTVTHAYIDSYNNEDLPGEWISSEDVYIPGTKPTVGAHVVYKMDEEDYEIYQIQPRDVKMLEGINNIWSNAGPVSVTYIPDL